MGPYASNSGATGWIYNVATGLYAVASASGSFFFALNFGTEGMSPESVIICCVLSDMYRWDTRGVLGLQSLRHPRDPTDICRSLVVLGGIINESI